MPMSREPLNAREMLLLVLASAITIFFFISGNTFWEHKVQRGVWYLVLGVGLALVFFRKRKIVFAIIVMTFILVNVGLTAPFHSSPLGYLLTASSAAGLCLMIRWQVRTYPELNRKDMHKLFDHDPPYQA